MLLVPMKDFVQNLFGADRLHASSRGRFVNHWDRHLHAAFLVPAAFDAVVDESD